MGLREDSDVSDKAQLFGFVEAIICFHLFVMIRAVVQNAHCPVKLFCEYEAYHLM